MLTLILPSLDRGTTRIASRAWLRILLALAYTQALACVEKSAQPFSPESTVVRVVVQAESGYAIGSGFFVNDTHVVTNEHVATAGPSNNLFISFPGRDAPSPVTLVFSNPHLDLALLAYRGSEPREPLALSSGDPERGVELFALGYPGPADVGSVGSAASSTLTEGILSRPPFQTSWGRTGAATVRALQHTAAINPGSSGGPLVNGCGAVVGVNTAGVSTEVRDLDGDVIGTAAAQGIFFALAVSELSAELRRRGVDFSAAEDCAPEVRAFPFAALSIGLLLLALIAAGAWLIVRRSRQARREDGAGAPAVGTGTASQVASGGPAGSTDRDRSLAGPVVPPATVRLTGRSGAPDVGLGVSELKRARHGISFGRHSRLVDRAVSDPTLSRRHFRVSLENDRLFVEDLGSTHGTFVNGTRLKPYRARRLEDGDTVQAGRGEWRFAAKKSEWK